MRKSRVSRRSVSEGRITLLHRINCVCGGVCVHQRERERAKERLLIFCRRELLLWSIFIVCCPTSFITPFYFFSKLCQAAGRFNSFLFLVFRFICGDTCMDLTAKWAGHLVEIDTFSLQDHGESPLCSLFFFRVHAQFGYSPIFQLSLSCSHSLSESSQAKADRWIQFVFSSLFFFYFF